MNNPVLAWANLALACVLIGALVGYFMRAPRKAPKQKEKASEDMPPAPPMLMAQAPVDPSKKPGWKCTETWLAFGAAIALIAQQVGEFLATNQTEFTDVAGQWGLSSRMIARTIALVLIVRHFVAWRSQVKMGHPPAENSNESEA